MEVVTIIVGTSGVIGSVASIVALFRGATSRKERFRHAAWGLAVAIFAGAAVWSQQKLSRVERVERAASELIQDRDFNYTDDGFVQAALVFLETNKDLYPESYARAQEICQRNNCLGRQYTSDNSDDSNHAQNQIYVASALEGLLRGIAVLNNDS